MKALLVDDEPLALFGLQKVLQEEVYGVEVAATYTNPKQVIEGVLEHCPDVVFLDIHMPEIDGLQLGRQLQTVVPGIEIVFVTSYDQYAVHAFELYALDYIMKPVHIERLRQTVSRIKERLSFKGFKGTSKWAMPMVCCFEQLQFQQPGMQAQPIKWRTSKVQELFAYLLHHRGRAISRGGLLELLWPDTDETKAAQHLYTSIYHIRQTLKSCNMNSISIRAGDLGAGYQLDIGDAVVDVELWEGDLKQLPALNADTADAYEQLLKLYRGDYLGQYGYLWAEYERERLRMLWLYQAKNLSRFYEQQGILSKAIQVYLDIQRRFPEEEDCYFSLMKLYKAIDNPIGIEEQYLLLKMRIEKEMDLPISKDITGWYAQWKTGASSVCN